MTGPDHHADGRDSGRRRADRDRPRTRLPASRPLAIWALGLGLAGSLPLAAGCEDEPPPPLPEPPPPPPPEPIVGPRPRASNPAFDLVVADGGAVLVWAMPYDRGGGVHLVPLTALGDLRGEQHSIVQAGTPGAGAAVSDQPLEAVEVAAASGGGRLGVAWAVREQTGVRGFATHGPATGETFGPPEALGPMDPGTLGRRGLLAMAASPDGTVALLHRGPRRACADHRGEQCTGLSVVRLGQASDARRGVGLSIPRPCGQAVLGHLFVGGSWYYGVCAEAEAGPTNTIYAIQFEPEYAQAVPLLPGCTVEGMAPGLEGVVLVGDCGGQIEAVRVTRAARQQAALHNAQKEIRCANGLPALRLFSAGGAEISLPLSAPAAGLAPLLPSRIAPAGSRAVWTGEALLVAVPRAREVAMHRYQCRDGQVVRTDGF